MHRFYVVHSFKSFHRHLVATSSLFLAAKSEEQPRKLQHVAQASFACVNKDQPMLDIQSQTYTKLVEDITYYELVLLETLGFEVQVDHPHPHVVKCMQFLRASKDLAQMAYFMAHNSLLLTTFCLEHSPSTVACVCIHLSCRWKGLDIPRSSDGKSWWEYIDPSINRTKLDELTKEFLMIYDKSPSRLQKKITEPIKMQGGSSGPSSGSSKSPAAVLLPNMLEKGKQPTGLHGHLMKHQHQKANPHAESSSHGNKPHPPPTGDRELKNPHTASVAKEALYAHHLKSPILHKLPSGDRSHHNLHPHPSGDRQTTTKANLILHMTKPHHRHPQPQPETHGHSHSHMKPTDHFRSHGPHHPQAGRGVKRHHAMEKEVMTQGKKRVKTEHNLQPPLPPVPAFPPPPPLPSGPPPPPNFTGTLHSSHPPLLPHHHHHGPHHKHRVNSLVPPLPPPLPLSPSPPPPPPPR